MTVALRPDATASPRSESRARTRGRRAVLHLDGPVTLEHGGRIERPRIAYELLGNVEHPLVIVLGGISAGRHVASSDIDPAPGWWESIVGSSLAIDTQTRCVVAIDWIGGAGESSGPAECAGEHGPVAVDTKDQARAIAAVLDELHVDAAECTIGASYGGMVALAFAALFGERAGRVLAISAAHESHPMATALRSLQRQVIHLGLGTGRERDAVAIARGIAVTTYRTSEEFASRFGGAPVVENGHGRFPVEGYLAHQGARFADRFAPLASLCLSESVDLHRVVPESVRVPTTLVGVEGDPLVPTWQLRELLTRLPGRADLHVIESAYGHDAFLKECETISALVAGALTAGAAA